MIRRLRTRHRWLIAAVALCTALLAAWALTASAAEPPSRRVAEHLP
ncbi:MAG: hypothetical protein SF070_17180 [Gemmatimonadota bacterium]|nr:hypothetical protein [Gemmatimonadota bacterium]